MVWVLDGVFCEGFGVFGIDEYIFVWGMDCLFVGYVLGDVDIGEYGWILLDGGLWLVEGVYGL